MLQQSNKLFFLLTALIAIVACSGERPDPTPYSAATAQVSDYTTPVIPKSTSSPISPPSTPVPISQTPGSTSGNVVLEPTVPLPDKSDGTRVIISAGSIARYIVTEQLARFDVPNDAIGSTNHIDGFLSFNEDGTIDEGGSRFRMDLRTLKSDKARREAYIRNNTYKSDRFPFTEFAALEARGLPWPLPTEGEATFQLVGDMTIHGVTAPLTWNVDASFKTKGANGQATTNFRFDTFGMKIPRLLFILSVEDNIRLELDLVLDIVNTY